MEEFESADEARATGGRGSSDNDGEGFLSDPQGAGRAWGSRVQWRAQGNPDVITQDGDLGERVGLCGWAGVEFSLDRL